jgi:hypothetical protein
MELRTARWVGLAVERLGDRVGDGLRAAPGGMSDLLDGADESRELELEGAPVGGGGCPAARSANFA